MTQRRVSEPTEDRHGAEVHPAFGMISAHRGQYGSSKPGEAGAVLFDSDIKHQETITVTIYHASRKRDLHHDWVHPHQQFVEVELSLAQWASFVSSMNTTGVPCTVRQTETDFYVDALPYAPRLAETMKETHDAAERAFADVKKAFLIVKEKPTKANIRDLEIALQNATPNVDFAGKQLVKQAEDVVQKARADIEAMVTTRAAQLGITTQDIPHLEIGGPE
jgi:hypothetical protein